MTEKKGLRGNLEAQLAELELLGSMYSGKDELQINHLDAIPEAEDFIQGGIWIPKNHIDFTLNLQVSGPHTVQLSVNFPFAYPSDPEILPTLYIRTPSLDNHVRINDHLSEYLKCLSKIRLSGGGDEETGSSSPVLECINWIHDSLPKLIEEEKKMKEKKATKATRNHSCKKTGKQRLVRMWINSHHIYNSEKRRTIVEIGSKAGLTGFSLPGKPGLVCLEGEADICEEAWKEIRAMRWQKITLKLTEEIQSPVFDNFSEVSFIPAGTGHDKHMDMGAFRTFLDERGCGNIFAELVGVG